MNRSNNLIISLIIFHGIFCGFCYLGYSVPLDLVFNWWLISGFTVWETRSLENLWICQLVKASANKVLHLFFLQGNGRPLMQLYSKYAKVSCIFSAGTPLVHFLFFYFPLCDEGSCQFYFIQFVFFDILFWSKFELNSPKQQKKKKTEL